MVRQPDIRSPINPGYYFFVCFCTSLSLFPCSVSPDSSLRPPFSCFYSRVSFAFPLTFFFPPPPALICSSVIRLFLLALCQRPRLRHQPRLIRVHWDNNYSSSNQHLAQINLLNAIGTDTRPINSVIRKSVQEGGGDQSYPKCHLGSVMCKAIRREAFNTQMKEGALSLHLNIVTNHLGRI